MKKRTVLDDNPEMMTVISNIQTMSKKINSTYNSEIDFKRLEKMSEDELYYEQNWLIPEYNKTFNK